MSTTGKIITFLCKYWANSLRLITIFESISTAFQSAKKNCKQINLNFNVTWVVMGPRLFFSSDRRMWFYFEYSCYYYFLNALEFLQFLCDVSSESDFFVPKTIRRSVVLFSARLTHVLSVIDNNTDHVFTLWPLCILGIFFARDKVAAARQRMALY